MTTWAARSGQLWMLKVERAVRLSGLILFGSLCVVGVSLRRIGVDRLPSWMIALFFLLGVASLIGMILPLFVRCRVCRLQLVTSYPARQSRVPLLWVRHTHACPACGDDGSAKPEARSRWLQSGGEREAPYWSLRRIALALFLALLLAGGGIWYGASYGPDPATWQDDFVEGLSVDGAAQQGHEPVEAQ